MDTLFLTLQIASASSLSTVSLIEAIFSPVSGSTISSASTRPIIRSCNGSITRLPSTISSTEIPRTLLLRTRTSLASLSSTASMYSSVSLTPAGMISLPRLSTTEAVTSLPSIWFIIASRIEARTFSSGAPSCTVSVTEELPTTVSLLSDWPRRTSSDTPASPITCRSSAVSSAPTSKRTSPVSGLMTS